LRLSRVDAGKGLHGQIERDQVFISLAANHGGILQRDMRSAGSAFKVAPPCVVNQNSPHELGGNGKEMGAILPAHALVIDEPQVGFVNQSRGLQGVAGALPAHVTPSQTA